MSVNTDYVLQGIEIVEIPRSYIEQKKDSHVDSSKKGRTNKTRDEYELFMGSLMYTDVPFGFRLQVVNGEPKVQYVTTPMKHHISMVETSFSAHFPKFSIQLSNILNDYQLDETLSVAHISGIPRQAVGALNGLARVMISSDCSSMYQAWAFPVSPRRAKRFMTKHRFQSALQKSQKQETLQSWIQGQSTRTHYDVEMSARAKRYESEFKRQTSGRLLDCHVTLAFWGGTQSRAILENALAVLLGSISHEDRKLKLRTSVFTGNKAQKLFLKCCTLQSTRKSTQLLPVEANPFFQIPSTEIGIQQGVTSSFSTATSSFVSKGLGGFRSGHIALGNPYNNRILDSRRVKYFPLESLRKHFAIIGITGSGKSSTKNRIVIDAWKNGVPTLLIEPVKTDARSLMGVIPSIRVFTVGHEQISPFRLNPFHVTEGVHVDTHIGLLVSCFMAAWPVYGILASHLRRVIVRTYTNNGWDTVENIRGGKITLELFWQEAKRYVKTLKYGSELRKDFTGAILARIEDLCDPSRAAIFNSISEISMDELLSRPTIIELKHISDPEFRSFVLSLLLIRIYTHFDKLGFSDRLRNLLIIDEAHSLLEEIPRSVDSNDIASSKRKAIDQFINIIAESRSFGLGVGIADQNALRLSRDALKTCNTKIIHRVTSGEDRRLLADETGCNKEQMAQIDVLRVGEIIIRGADETVPSNVQVFYDPIEYPEMEKVWTDDDVREHMRSFYEEHVDFAKTPEPPVLGLEDDVDGSVSNAVQADDIVTDDGFKEKYIEAVNDPTADDQSLVEEIIAFYAVHATDSSPSSFEVALLLAERASELYRVPSYNLDWTKIRNLIGSHIHSFLDESEGGGRV